MGLSSRDSSRVEVPFAHVAPPEAEIWTEDTASELRVPIGRTGATKFQYLAIGKGTCQHALVAGKTGSGKSTLFHVIITNLALWCSPEQVEFYLVDFKKGVEFKCYATHRLPHARVVAIESDREFGLSVLQRVDDELKHRGDLFRQLGVQDVAGYKRAGGTEPIPRSLLIIDEFQEFFVEDDRISQTASLLLDRLVRQGRAFGIHVVLGSQTLGGAYTVARTTLGQMVIRVALQCNEADAYLIMDENNPAPRLLSRPGEGIYNDMAGMIEGNSPFQVVWLPDQVRETYLAKVRARADAGGSPKSEVRSPKSRGRMAGRCIRGRLCLRGMRRRTCGRMRCCGVCWRRLPSSRRRRGAFGWARPTPSRGRRRRCSSGKAGTICCWWVSATRRCWPCCRVGPGLPGRTVSAGDGALHSVRWHGARHLATRVYRADHPGHPAPDHAGQTGRPGRRHAGVGAER